MRRGGRGLFLEQSDVQRQLGEQLARAQVGAGSTRAPLSASSSQSSIEASLSGLAGADAVGVPFNKNRPGHEFLSVETRLLRADGRRVARARSTNSMIEAAWLACYTAGYSLSQSLPAFLSAQKNP